MVQILSSIFNVFRCSGKDKRGLYLSQPRPLFVYFHSFQLQFVDYSRIRTWIIGPHDHHHHGPTYLIIPFPLSIKYRDAPRKDGRRSREKLVFLRQKRLALLTDRFGAVTYAIKKISGRGPWWWSSGQLARLLLWQSEIESCWTLQFFAKIVSEKNVNKQSVAVDGSFLSNKGGPLHVLDKAILLPNLRIFNFLNLSANRF